MKRLLITIFLSAILSTSAYAVPYAEIPDGRIMFEVPTICSSDVAMALHIAKQRQGGMTAEQQLAQVTATVHADLTISPQAIDFAKAMIGYMYARPLITDNQEIIKVVDMVIDYCMSMQPVPKPPIYKV